jgi:hypothetical protein
VVAARDEPFSRCPPGSDGPEAGCELGWAEKVVAAMMPPELDALIADHYQGESQTLTTAAEQNLLKLGELRGTLTPVQLQRWTEIKLEYVRQRRMGGGADDPVTCLVGTLSGLGNELGSIQKALVEKPPAPDSEAWLGPRLDALAAWLAETVNTHAATVAPAPTNGAASSIEAQQLLQQVRRIEQSLVPVGAAVDQRAGDTPLANKMVQIIELLEQLDARLSR